MSFKYLSLINFRNINQLQLDFNDKFNIFIGDNGQGKTNLLEAIYFCDQLRSFRTSSINELILKNETEAKISCSFDNIGINHTLEISISDNKKKAWYDSKSVNKISQLSGNLVPFVFSGEQIFLFRNYPIFKRKLFDKYLCLYQKDYINLLRESRRIRQQKIILLKSNSSSKQLFVWNQLLGQNIYSINKNRADFIEKINKSLHPLSESLLGKPIQLQYRPNIYGNNAEQIIDYLNQRLSKEKQRQQILYGNQLDKFICPQTVRHENSILSNGQFRVLYYCLLLAINLNLSSIENRLVLYLIDDIMSELSQKVVSNLLAKLNEFSFQFFITATQPLDNFNYPADIYLVKEGTFKQI